MRNDRTVTVDIRSNPVGELTYGPQAFSAKVERFLEEAAENSFEYRRKGQKKVTVAMSLSRRSATVDDDAAGMSLRDLKEYFFHMHADKRRRRGDRNRFCTGVKLAALSAGRRMDVLSVRDGKTVKCSLDSARIARGDATVKVVESSTRGEDGTQLCLSGIRQRTPIAVVAQYLSSKLRVKCLKNVMTLNGKRLSFEPPALEISARPAVPALIRKLFGKCSLRLGYSKKELPKTTRGVAFIAGESVHELGFLGDERSRAIAAHLFGEFYCPGLPADDPANRTAITRERNGLNDEHEAVKALKEWVAAELTKVADEARKDRGEDHVDPAMEKHCQRLAKNLNKAMAKLLKAMSLTNLAATGQQTPCKEDDEDEDDEVKRKKRKKKPSKPGKKRLRGIKILPKRMGAAADRAIMDDGVQSKTVLWVNADDHCLSKCTKGTPLYLRTFDEIAVSELALALAEKSLDLDSELSAADPSSPMREACPDFSSTIRHYERELAGSCA